MAEFVKKRFVHLTHLSNGRTLFANAETYADTTDYYTLTGSTAEDAEFVDFSGNDLQGYTIIPTTAVVFVDFPDGTTGIISHLKFYSKLDELSGGETPAFNGIKLLDSTTLPTLVPHGMETDISIGDVCCVRDVTQDGLSSFQIGVCTNIAEDGDPYSGYADTVYTWQVVCSWPNSEGWVGAATPLGS